MGDMKKRDYRVLLLRLLSRIASRGDHATRRMMIESVEALMAEAQDDVQDRSLTDASS